ncbi:ATP-binding protein [Candidatus Merdisoma sp. JLR.KK006]|uniref:ATP-binding protein n=1 Tax=Candidatus Merdisoma sp. JLR.KK006 TaxID=3112626 RepID=UPI002FEEAF45
MYVENANRAMGEGMITPENLEPNPKNPIIASFFRNIGYSDQLGSGVRNLFKYVKLYSGKEPEFKEGDVFRIMVPLDEAYSYDAGNIVQKNADKVPINSDGLPIVYKEEELTKQQLLIVKYLQKYENITSGKAQSIR